MLGPKILEKFRWQAGRSDDASQVVIDRDARAHYEKALNLAERGLHTQAREELKQAVAMIYGGSGKTGVRSGR